MVGKVSKLQNIRQTVQAAQAAEIAVVCSMIVPLPHETEQTFQESLKPPLELRPDSVPVQFPGLLPGTPWFEEPQQYGFELDKAAYLRENIAYKIKLLLPPTFWQPPAVQPQRGRLSREAIRWTMRMTAALEA